MTIDRIQRRGLGGIVSNDSKWHLLVKVSNVGYQARYLSYGYLDFISLQGYLDDLQSNGYPGLGWPGYLVSHWHLIIKVSRNQYFISVSMRQ